MTHADIARFRLFNQSISHPVFQKPEEVVHWMTAMQAQEYAMAKWAIGLRLPESQDAIVEKAFNEGRILRTHVMRPTWHFVAPSDIRWLVELTAPRIHKLSAYMYRQLEINAKLVNKANHLLEKVMHGGQFLDRAEIRSAFQKARINADGMRLGYILFCAELDLVICSGPRRGKQFTYALLEERVAPAKKRTRQEALNELVHRYFASRGPATLHDFSYWSGLTLKDAREGADALSADFIRESLNGREHIFKPSASGLIKASKARSSFLMPDYDEYGMSYEDRSAITAKKFDSTQLLRDGNTVFNRMIVLDGLMWGTWKRSISSKTLDVETLPFAKLSKAQTSVLEKAVKRFSGFVALPVVQPR